MKISNCIHNFKYSNYMLKKFNNPFFPAKQAFIGNLSDKTLRMASLAATSVGVATLSILKNNKSRAEETMDKDIKVYELESKPSEAITGPIITPPAQLSLFHMHDFHGQSERMERAYTASEEFQNGELQQTDIFEESIPTDKLKLCSGDMFIGESHQRIAMVNEFLNSIGVIASALGNHECDSSIADFAGLTKGKKYRLVSTNLHPNRNHVINQVISDSFIIETNGNKYGIIGVSPVDFMKHANKPEEISRLRVDTIAATIKEIQEDVDKIKQNGINKIILLSHLGIDFDREIAQKVNDVDIILGGHTHTLFTDVKEGENLFFSPKGEPVLIVQSGKDGEYIGVPNLKFDELGRIIDIDYQVIKTDDYERSEELKADFRKYSEQSQVIGTIRSITPQIGNTYISENPSSNFLLDCLRIETGTDIAIMNSSSMRNKISTGDLSTFDLENIDPFMNKIIVIQASEKELVSVIQERVKETCQSSSYRPGILQVSGLRYRFDIQKGQLTSLCFIDKSGIEHKIDIDNPSDKMYTIAVNEFCAADPHSGLGLKYRAENPIKKDGFDLKKYIIDWCLKHKEPIDIKLDGRISIE